MALWQTIGDTIGREIASLRRRLAVRRCLHRLAADAVPQVYHGPFTGMRYIRRASGSQLLPKIIGSYEEPIHDWVLDAVKRRYRRILDVGCAEGYYAVGLARACPESEVFAFDIQPKARDRCRGLADLNGVENIEIGGCCDHATLERLVDADTLVFLDIEGAERELLDPSLAPSLRAADLILELHDFIAPGTREALFERFGETHHIDLVTDFDRDPSRYPALCQLPPELRELALDERREPEMQWLRARSRRTTAAPGV